MAEAELCRLEGEVFDAENAGENDSCNISADESIDSEAKEDGDDLDDDAGKFGEAKTYVVDTHMPQTHYTPCDGLTEKCGTKCNDNPDDKLILF